MSEVILASLWSIFTSDAFKAYLKKLSERKPKPKPVEVRARTVEELAEKQAEGLTYEQIYLNLLSGTITSDQATEIIQNLGGTVNPNPYHWLKNKLGT